MGLRTLLPSAARVRTPPPAAGVGRGKLGALAVRDVVCCCLREGERVRPRPECTHRTLRSSMSSSSRALLHGPRAHIYSYQLSGMPHALANHAAQERGRGARHLVAQWNDGLTPVLNTLGAWLARGTSPPPTAPPPRGRSNRAF
eukprot:scaffold320058_cov27-Tisochrysis_lutea.AAC.2